ncbi:1-deoxy-D-xylulose-5-phosphate synthase [Adlercreutzia shanghongiae]|uniref:1-deoxy-D-xylulose-5-phosphate synthase n=1 Tax=Adlercreutzia shanghongiae TaxID=3111773 RepID=A0ABU6J0W0_9ACTN|nr:1-deoxy-D-xylulose-5-phosphate synthase [Adlercreutzia sp. R22]MEC4295742.1 1-deoxy-D-xylulose-5-phosphate synthase [Adlercreutzia sp. R22]
MDTPRILDAITSPADLKVLTNEELAILAREIRQEIVATTSVTGGHVASSLGAVDIIVALESLLDMPRDRVVFDVGHQAYAHKLITGRREAFKTLRTYGGISGFTKPHESPYDVHYSGHASDSLSIATGLAKARQLKGTDEKVVALIGDASLAGGMAFEALNYMGNEQLPLVVILNDNEMSISRNVGALMKHLGNIRANSHYREAREGLQAAMEQGGPAARGLLGFGKNMKESLKQMVIPHTMIYESLGIVCTAPIDGHNIAELRDILSLVLEMDGPALVHVVTRKGEGYEPARRDPEAFHGTGPYDIATGKAVKKPAKRPTYTEVFGAAMADEAAHDADVVAITAAMTGGTGLKTFAAEFPDRFVDVGIAEEQAVGMAAGLAAGGKKPVAALYSTFMQRAVDQLIIDCALPEANVVLAFDRAGLVGDDGPTHHGVFDMVYTRMVPNVKVLAPSDEAELVHALHTALALPGPVALRYPRGEAEGAVLPEAPEVLEVGVSRTVREGDDVALLAFGRMVGQAKRAAEFMAAEGIQCRVVDMRWAKPLDEEAIAEAAKTRLVVTLEEGVVAGGVGEAVLEVLARQGATVSAITLGIPDRFVGQGHIDQLFKEIGLDAEAIAACIQERMR